VSVEQEPCAPVRSVIGWIKLEPLLAAVLWGGIYPSAKLGLREIPVLSFTALRLVVASCVLFMVFGRHRGLDVRRAPFTQVLNAGLAQTAFQLLLIAGLYRTTAGNSAILLATAPLMTAAWLALTKRDSLTWRQLGGLLLGIVGVGLVVRQARLDIGSSEMTGNAIALAAAGAWAWYSIAIGPVVNHLGAGWATGLTMVSAAAVVTPLALPELGTLAWQRVSWEAWAGLVYGSTVGMVVAMTLWGRSVSKLGPKETMTYIYLEPASAVVIAAVLLGESFGLLQGLGAMVIFVALWIASAPQMPAPEKTRT
jgi:drug/metabolite transporter (DMT)-like permease